MKITLNQIEIEEALKQYVSEQGIAVNGKSIEVNITAGRGPNGVTAELDIVAEKAAPVAAPRPVAVATAPSTFSMSKAESLPEPKEAVEAEEVAEQDAVEDKEEEKEDDGFAPFSGGKSLFNN
jgi:hypothetical protein